MTSTNAGASPRPQMRQVPLERHINIAVLVEVANQERAINGNVDIML